MIAISMRSKSTSGFGVVRRDRAIDIGPMNRYNCTCADHGQEKGDVNRNRTRTRTDDGH
jgi:hypothetical protein